MPRGATCARTPLWVGLSLVMALGVATVLVGTQYTFRDSPAPSSQRHAMIRSSMVPEMAGSNPPAPVPAPILAEEPSWAVIPRRFPETFCFANALRRLRASASTSHDHGFIASDFESTPVSTTEPVVVSIVRADRVSLAGTVPCALQTGERLVCVWQTDDSPILDTALSTANAYFVPDSAPAFKQGTRSVVVLDRAYASTREGVRLRYKTDFLNSQLKDPGRHHVLVSYRMDSDVPTPFTPRGFGKAQNFAERQSRALFLANECPSLVQEYVGRLMNYFPVDAAGRCLHNTGMRVTSTPSPALMKQYKFVLVVSDRLADFDVGPEVYSVLGAVPVYFGAVNADMYLPHGSAVYAADHPDPQHLAFTLHRVSNDEELFDGYHKWRRSRLGDEITFAESLARVDFRCRVCRKLAHRCSPRCSCGGKRVLTAELYDGLAWSAPRAPAHSHHPRRYAGAAETPPDARAAQATQVTASSLETSPGAAVDSAGVDPYAELLRGEDSLG